MSFVVPDKLKEIWAKSPATGKADGETLVEHTYRVLERLSDQYCLRPNLGRELSCEHFWHRAFWAGFLHDFGKVAVGFQKQVRPSGKVWGMRHEVLSLAFLDWVFPKDSGDRIWIISTIVSHHRDIDYIRERYPSNLDVEDDSVHDMLENIPDPVLQGLREWLYESPRNWISKLGLQDAGIEIPEATPLESSAEFRELGLRRVHDALGEYSRFVKKLRLGSSKDRDNLMALAHRGVMMTADHAGSAHAQSFLENPLPDPDSLADDIKSAGGIPNLHPHQRLCQNSKGSVMFASPTGSGKTEAALLWAANQSEEEKAPRLYYVLPFQASMNAMRERLDGLFPGHVGLQHGRSRFALYRAFLAEGDTQERAAARARTAENLTRLHYYPIQILTPYQMLVALYRLRGYESTLTDTFGSLFVLDEIHAYEVQRLALILKMLEYIGSEYNVRFCIMSATFPKILEDWLSEAIPSLVKLDVPDSLFASFRRHRLKLLNGEVEDETSIRKILDSANVGSVLVCCNTVRRAQTVYEKLKSSGAELKIELLHGRFNARDRAGKERRLLSQMGTRTKPDAKGTVLVATQVVEVSLDIDFDTIFTEPAPLDALLQRFGRVNRGRRSLLKDVHVFQEPHEDVPVYDPVLIQRTLKALETANETAIDEKMAGDWLDEVYSGEVSERWKHEYRKHSEIFERVCIETLHPYQTDRDLQRTFYEAFDGVEVLPFILQEEYSRLREEDPLRANELLVNISWGQFKSAESKGLVIQSTDDDWLKVVVLPYDDEFGLRMESPEIFIL